VRPRAELYLGPSAARKTPFACSDVPLLRGFLILAAVAALTTVAASLGMCGHWWRGSGRFRAVDSKRRGAPFANERQSDFVILWGEAFLLKLAICDDIRRAPALGKREL
jgi:hypothetical protein